jgi:hypothetical protein
MWWIIGAVVFVGFGLYWLACIGADDYEEDGR